MKITKTLSFTLLWKITAVIILSFSLVGFGSIRRARKYNNENLILASEETLNEILYVVANVNSVLMQQMRMYTKFDDITSTSSDPQKIHQELIKIKSKRYKEFRSVSYIDYTTGFEYFDDGSVMNASQQIYLSKLRCEAKKQKAGQLYTEELEPGIYGVCKEPDTFDNDGFPIGCYIGRAKVGYLQRFLDKLYRNDISSSRGFPIILSSNLDFICSPDKDYVKEKKLTDFKVSTNIVDYVKKPYEKDINGKKIVLTGDIVINNTKCFISVGLFSKTSWVLGIITPYEAINRTASKTTLFIILYGSIATILSLFIIYFCFLFEFRPLMILNKKFIDISNGDADLTKRIETKQKRKTEVGEIQESFNTYLSNLQGMIKDLAKTKDDITKISSKFATTLSSTKKEFDNISKEIKKLEAYDNVDIANLHKASANLDFLIPELESLIKEIYRPIGRLSSNISGFKY